MTETQEIRVGIVGCGAITETGHLPAARLVRGLRVVGLIDINRAQAERLARIYGVPHFGSDLRDLPGRVDAAIVATPPHLHLEHAGFLVRQGIPVLCEKPLANTVAECQQLADLAAGGGVVFAVGHVRRYFYYARRMKELLAAGSLGAVRGIYADEGLPYGWPARTDFAFQPRLSPGGVTLDTGVHLLDLFSWLIGPVVSLEYADDAIGGIESNAKIRLTFENGAEGRIHVSRTCRRKNCLKVVGEKGTLEAEIYCAGRLVFSSCGAHQRRCEISPDEPTLASLLRDQLADFVRAIRGEGSVGCSVHDGLRAVQLVEQCYRQVRLRPLPSKAPIPGVVAW